MTSELTFTGERFLPGTAGSIAYEHWHRYAFAGKHAVGRRVLDAACGEGYGTALLARSARHVTGVDLDSTAVAHALQSYADRPRIAFVRASVAALPLADAAFDLVVSFETIEHLPQALQAPMLAEFARVLAPGGLLVLSSPNRPEYSEARNYRNPFHLYELDRAELAALLAPDFPAVRWYRQAPLIASALWSDDAASIAETFVGEDDSVNERPAAGSVYYLVVAAKDASALPSPEPRLSIYVDRDDSEAKRLERQERELVRVDNLAAERQAACDRQMAHIEHLERLVAARDAAIVERDAAISARDRELAVIPTLRGDLERMQQAHRANEAEAARLRHAVAHLEVEERRLSAALEAQERIIAFRQSARWWVLLPWMRVRLWWQRHLASDARR